MPRQKKRDFLNSRWDYTLLADDFASIDQTAQNLDPKAGTLSWRGYQYPDMVYDIIDSITAEKGPWWLPDDEMWNADDFLLKVLSKAYLMRSVPVIKDTLLEGNDNVEIIQRATVHIPQMEPDSGKIVDRRAMKIAMQNLVTSSVEDKIRMFSELVKTLDEYPKQNSFKVRLCLIKFSHRIWLEGIYHDRIIPVIAIPTNVFGRYHSQMK